MTRDRVLKIIYLAVEEINDSRSQERRIPVSEETALFGSAGQLESVELVNLIVSTELLLEGHLAVQLSLADDQDLWEGENALRNVGTFTDYVHRQLIEGQPA